MTTIALTREEALAASKAWVKDRIEKPKTVYSSRKNGLLTQLAARCAAESLKQGDGEYALEDRLQRAWDLVDSIQMNAQSDKVRDLVWKKSEEDMSPEELKLVETARHQICRRHDPLRAFREGLGSEHMPNIDKQHLLADCADYLEQTWLRHPVLDYILLDMLITRELCAFGEHIKEFMMPFPKDAIGLNRKYLDAKGNLNEMRKVRWKELGARWGTWSVWALFLPGAAVILAYLVGADGVADTIMAGWAGLMAAHFGFRFLRFVLRGIGLGRYVDPSHKAKLTWEEMYKVWKALEGPVVNPAMVKEAMVKSKEAGAVWDAPAYSIIEKVIADDPAAWVVDPSRR
ncbi:hypothetical protein [Microvirga sp. Mcv34]|uniref:hypothetical protein n=1 Tax=Microvirga sp. Mcv34 TaxID=2926016 RepID=UPI0021C803C8|nr:hypothetical protein [Microvirga sp. Mcv34]